MKKQGFTLVELLAVIVILGVLALIIVPNITKTLKNQKESLYNTQIKNIEDSAKSWAAENFFSLPEEDTTVDNITVFRDSSNNIYIKRHLKDLEGFIDLPIEDPRDTSKTFGQCLQINITLVSQTNGYTYQVVQDTIYNNTGC